MKTHVRSRRDRLGSLPLRFRGATALVAATVLVVVMAEGLPFSIAAEPPAVSQSEMRNSAIILVKNTLIAVNQGNLTGNYTVLRDLASPGFRERNSGADLATIFQNLRKQKIDMSPIVLLDPILTKPKLTDEGLLLLKGYFPSEPVRINFELAYLKAGSGGWMIHGVSIGTAAVEMVAINEPAGKAQPSSAGQATPSSRVIPASSEPSDSESTAARPKSAPAPSSLIRRSKP